MYHINVTETGLDGFPEMYLVGMDNEATDDFDSRMTFGTKQEAINWCLSDEAMEWKSPLACVEFDVERD